MPYQKGMCQKKERKQWVLRCPPKRETKMGTKVPVKSENKI
jgi:hypothetical protein